MKKLRYSTSAEQDIADIFIYIARRSESRVPARKLIAALRLKCHEIASLSGTMGRARPELGDEVRSRAFGNYIILFRYEGHFLHIVRILEAHRDIQPDDVRDSN